MINRLKKLITDYVFSERLSIDARMINTIFLLGFAGAFCVLLSRLVVGSNMALIVIILVILVVIAVFMFLCNHYQWYKLGTWLAVIVISEILFPLAFFFIGGINSSMAAYFILSIVIIFFLLRGKRMVVMLVIQVVLIVSCYLIGATYPDLVVTPTPLQRLEDSIFSVIILGSVVGAIIKFQAAVFSEERVKNLNTSEALASALSEVSVQDNLLRVGNAVAETLLLSNSDNIKDTLLKGMEMFGTSIGIDRLYIWRIKFINGERVYAQEYEWFGKEFANTNTLQSVMGLNYIQGIPRWETLFAYGELINDPISTFPQVEQELLAPLDLKSLLVIPAFLDDRLWGFVSYDNCRIERVYTADEVSILKSGTMMFANAIERSNDLRNINSRLNQQQLMSSIAQHFISSLPMEKLITEALGQISEFLHATRALISVTDKTSEESHVRYRWAISEEWIPKPSRTGFNEIVNNAFPRKLPDSGNIEAIYCNNVHDDSGGKYRVFEQAGMKAFVWAPIYVEGEFWGMLSIEDCLEYRNWSESDRQLVGSAVSAIAGGVARDLIEKERVNALDEAVRASKAKGDFLSNMSHEMRTPMNVIIGMTTIGESAETVERKDYAFQKISNASTHLLGVINDILDMSKIESDKLELYNSDFDFEATVHRVTDIINFRVEERKQVFNVDIDPAIPHVLHGDDQRLAQVITNLLSNAVKFTPEDGKIALRFRLLGDSEDMVSIQGEVSDTGIGITDDQKERLFNPFEQAESGTQRKFGGTGLGLAISERIVKMMGGRIWIESELEQGSTFFFTFSMKRGKLKTEQLQSSERDAENEMDSFREYRVLLAEDILVNQEIVLALLEPTGLQITCVENGALALQAFSEAPDDFDVIFMDMQMPEMDGCEATRQIRALDFEKARQIPIIAMTANVFKEDIEKALAAGMNDHLGKPIDLDSVLSKLRLYLSR